MPVDVVNGVLIVPDPRNSLNRFQRSRSRSRLRPTPLLPFAPSAQRSSEVELPRNAIDGFQLSHQQNLHLLFAPSFARANPDKVQASLPHLHHRHPDNHRCSVCRLQSRSMPACVKIVEAKNSRPL